MKPCVVPVSAQDALAWAAGRLSDSDLLLRAPLVPQAVFLVNLPDHKAYRETLKQVRYWRERGCVFMVTRTGNPVVDDHIVLKNGGQETYREPWNGKDTCYRFILLPDAFKGWVEKFSPRRIPSPAPALRDPVSPHVHTAGASSKRPITDSSAKFPA